MLLWGGQRETIQLTNEESFFQILEECILSQREIPEEESRKKITYLPLPPPHQVSYLELLPFQTLQEAYLPSQEEHDPSVPSPFLSKALEIFPFQNPQEEEHRVTSLSPSPKTNRQEVVFPFQDLKEVPYLSQKGRHPITPSPPLSEANHQETFVLQDPKRYPPSSEVNAFLSFPKDGSEITENIKEAATPSLPLQESKEDVRKHRVTSLSPSPKANHQEVVFPFQDLKEVPYLSQKGRHPITPSPPLSEANHQETFVLQDSKRYPPSSEVNAFLSLPKDGSEITENVKEATSPSLPLQESKMVKTINVRMEDVDLKIRFVRDTISVRADFGSNNPLHIRELELGRLVNSLEGLGFRVEHISVRHAGGSLEFRQDERRRDRDKDKVHYILKSLSL
ncbi:hypothetical protein Thal_0809 [Thermocrinis albus DSM 14484]|uniref:Uncharacterized protein n=2 Tax=Thermocrinis TaxID=75905 RepID=D3SL12_THEAH|nr:hypothetical protein Thal_0809 [Thermocrinis albus DSM 14484]